MDTEFVFLKQLEQDLTESARIERRRMTEKARTHRSHRRTWIGAAASFLAIAFTIGFLVQGGTVRQAAFQGGSFSTVGNAVDGQGGDQSKRGVNGAPDIPAPRPAFGQTGNRNGSASELADLSKIVRDGAVVVTISDGGFTESQRRVFAIAGSNGGSVLSSTTAGGDSGTYTLRIPASNFDKAMVQLGTLGTVDSSEIHGQDVTAEYVDAKAHVKIYASRRSVLYGLMAQNTSIGQSLAIQNQLDQVQLKIDQITGQIRYLNNQVAESTIKIDIHEPDAAVANTTNDDIRNPSLGRAFERAVQGFMNILAAVLIGFGYLIPLLVIAGVVYLGVVAVRRRSRRTAEDG